MKEILFAIVIALATSFALAQDMDQRQKGHELAQQLCAECHAVQKNEVPSPNPYAPRFESIASVSGMTSTALYAVLQTSHRSMPNLILEGDQMTNIVAYILSLKEAH